MKSARCLPYIVESDVFRGGFMQRYDGIESNRQIGFDYFNRHIADYPACMCKAFIG